MLEGLIIFPVDASQSRTAGYYDTPLAAVLRADRTKYSKACPDVRGLCQRANRLDFAGAAEHDTRSADTRIEKPDRGGAWRFRARRFGVCARGELKQYGMAVYQTRIGSAYENVARARRAVVAFAGHWFCGRDISDIESAVGEALANSAEYGAKTPGEIRIRCYATRETFVVDIKDSGDGFQRVSAVDYVKPFENATRGYGMFIMRELMDKVEYSEHGTRVRLKKRLPKAHASEAQASRA